MKKSLIALAAMSAVAGAAQAQSSVTVYGLVDSGYRSTSSDALKYTGSSNTTTVENRENKGVGSSSSASSRLGFRGTEDLGGGLRANFVVEVGLDATNATVSSMNNRQSFVGLSGGFGTLNIGTQYTAHHNIAAAFSPSTGVNLAGDLNYTTGPVTSGALSNLGITTTGTTIANNAAKSTIEGLFNAQGRYDVLVQGVAVADTNGVIAPPTVAALSSPVTSNLAALQTLLDATTTANLNTRLSRADMNGYTVRRNNTISYASPVMNGFQLGLGYNAPSTSIIEGGNQVKASSNTISASYTTGKFAAAAAVANGKSESVGAGAADSRAVGIVNTYAANAALTRIVGIITTPAAVTNAANTFTVKGRESIAAASYDFGVAKVGYIYSAKKAKDTVSDLIDRDSNSVNVSMPFGKVTAWANYAKGDQNVLPGTANEVKYDMSAMQLGARYAFSKRTDAYAIYGQTKLDRRDSALDLKDTQTAVGIRHQF